ncbi:hypothetical protein NP493_1892g00010 [Ridgeia piscesae]|uniref:Uncharacterized protein n=1 Tax=Ridgeia piscesae TaxID=27915 RepID=A0AAD9N6H8_RIDPI|nr:hypothetical protein NP493_1892g00010 [Ridgeia piscesae]
MNADLMIGAEARKFISERETNGLRQMRIDEFFSSIRTYFVTVCNDTLESPLVLKSNSVSCIDREYSAATLRSLKSAYHRSLNTDKK